LQSASHRFTNKYTIGVGQTKVVVVDETGSKVANKKGWFHTWQTTALTFIAASINRG